MAHARLLTAFTRDQGQALVEYALILLLVAIIAVASLTLLGGRVSDFISSAYNAL